jgi:FkbM family methyltransferase
MKSDSEFYSQNFEDVFLARCFAGITDGFYIDVGAQHEEVDSVTRHFYEAGWSGINIEPVAEFAATFKCRERDLTVCCAAGSDERLMPMAISLDSGLSSLDQKNAANTESLGLLTETRIIHIRRLDDILLDIGLPEKDFEFLKVDVEGFELEVINGLNLHRYRPRIILCEVTEPNTCTKTENFAELCRVIESYDYTRVFFDGLNQWWCQATFFPELSQHFHVPPGVMDSLTISPYSGTSARKKLRHTQTELAASIAMQRQINEQIAELRQQLQEAHEQLAEANEARENALREIEAIHSSHSWRITQPFRKATQVFTHIWQQHGTMR